MKVVFEGSPEQIIKDMNWIAQVKGDPNGESWEISVVRKDNEHGQKSWGWFDENKLLISHSGGPCRWPLAPGLGRLMVQLAERYAAALNDRHWIVVPPNIELEMRRK